MESLLQILIVVLGSSAAGATINALLNKRKTKAQIENIIIQNYHTIIEDLQQEVVRMKEKILEMEQKEQSYSEQTSLIIVEKQALAVRITQLEKDNKFLLSENSKLKKVVIELKLKVKSNEKQNKPNV